MDFESLDKSIKNELLTSIPLFIFAILIPTLAWRGWFQLDENVGTWFQRSGSLMVLFAVWIEFKLFKITNSTNPISANGQTWDNLEVGSRLRIKYGKTIQKLKFLAAALALIGTLVWGYGDLFLSTIIECEKIVMHLNATKTVG